MSDNDRENYRRDEILWAHFDPAKGSGERNSPTSTPAAPAVQLQAVRQWLLLWFVLETIEAVSESAPPAQTTAEAIAELLVAEQQERPELTLVNFAPQNLLPGQSVPTKFRRPGSSLGRYRSMASDLFKN